jgi:hypothetical protein
VENERDSRRFESVYSTKLKAGKRRTYFFDVRRTKGEDFYLTLTESAKKLDGGYERHKIFLYKEDFNRFVAALEETLQHIKTELMPQYDYDEFARRQEEMERRYENGEFNENETRTPTPKGEKSAFEKAIESAKSDPFESFPTNKSTELPKVDNLDEDDMSW